MFTNRRRPSLIDRGCATLSLQTKSFVFTARFSPLMRRTICFAVVALTTGKTFIEHEKGADHLESLEKYVTLHTERARIDERYTKAVQRRTHVLYWRSVLQRVVAVIVQASAED